MNQPVTLINVFTVPAEQAPAFLTHWQDNATLMAAAPGFRDAQLHQATDDTATFQFVNVAHWDSADAWRAAVSDADFQTSIQVLMTEPGLDVDSHAALYRQVITLPDARSTA